jgi:hypothetical protein
MTERAKFDELRLKTDRQLIQLANTELDLGIRDAHDALEFAENWASAERHYLLAERAYAQATRLIRLTSDFSGDELSRVESRLKHLREGLSAISAMGSAPKEDEIAAFARTLSKAGDYPKGSPEDDWFRAEGLPKLQPACVRS